MVKIYLVRHCESEGNACRRAQAQFNGLVTEKGYRQSEYLRQRFSGIHLDAVYSSDTYRSYVTAKPIADERNLPIRLRMLLREITTGVWEDMAWGDIPVLYPKEHAVWEATPWDLVTPGGTTFQQAAERGIEGIRRIAAEVGDGAALVVSHSCTIKAMLCKLDGQPMSEVKQYGHGDNTSINELEVASDGTIKILRMGDSDHLPPGFQRAWSGVAGADVNMHMEPFDPESAADMQDYLNFRRQYAAEHNEAFDEASCKEEAVLRGSQKRGNIAFSVLRGRRCGFVELDEDRETGAGDAGILRRHCILPELQGKGYSDQLLGYAIHTFRFRDKHTLAIPVPVTPEDEAVARRFRAERKQGAPKFLLLNMDVPTLPEPILA